MSTNEKDVSTEVTTVTTGNHAETAQERVLELRRWREQIPHFIIPETPDATVRLTSAASVPVAFIELTNVTVANQPVLVRAEGLTPAQIRDLLDYAEAYGPLPDELEALAKFIRHSTAFARNTAGAEALTTYALAQRLAKRPGNGALVPYVADMRRVLGRGRKPTPEVLAQKAAERAAKAAAKVAARAAKAAAAAPKALPPAPDTTTEEPS
jgi:hypothetical protein